MTKLPWRTIALAVCVGAGVGAVTATVVGCDSQSGVRIRPPGPTTTTITIPTKPVPTNHPIEVRACFGSERCIIWLANRLGIYIHGPVDPTYAPALCAYRPDLGDVYYSEANGQVLTPPAGCPA